MNVPVTRAAEGLARRAFTRYDLDRKPLVYASFGVRELWVIDAVRALVHRHIDPAPNGYRRIEQGGDADCLLPAHAPAAFAFALNELEAL